MISQKRFSLMLEILIILFLPLSVYSIYAEKISIADVFLLFMTICAIMILYKKNVPLNKFISWDVFFYVVLIVFNTLIQVIINPESFVDGMFSFFRYLLFIIFVLIVPKYFVNNNRFFKIYKCFGVLFAIYSILQFIAFYSFNKILPNSIPFFSTMTDFSRILNLQRFNYGVLFRPYSCFQEPSYFSFFESFLFFKYLNFYDCKAKKDYFFISLMALALVISGTTGILAFIFSVFYKIFIEKKNKVHKFLFLLIIIVPLLFVFSNSNYGSKIISSIFVSENNTISLGYSTMGRIGNYENIFNNTDNISIVFGKGLWIDTEYLPSFGRLIVSFGVLGTIIFFIIMIKMYNKLTREGKCYWLILFISLFVSNSLFTISSVLVFSLLIMNYKKRETINF